MPFSAIDHPNRVGITAPSSDSSSRLATTAFAAGVLSSSLAGGFGDWTTFVPTVGSQSGVIGPIAIVDGRFIQVGKFVHFYCRINISSIGTASGYLAVGLPVAPSPTLAYFGCYGRDATTNKSLNGIALSSVSSGALAVFNFDGTTPIGNGNFPVVEATYQSA